MTDLRNEETRVYLPGIDPTEIIPHLNGSPAVVQRALSLPIPSVEWQEALVYYLEFEFLGLPTARPSTLNPVGFPLPIHEVLQLQEERSSLTAIYLRQSIPHLTQLGLLRRQHSSSRIYEGYHPIGNGEKIHHADGTVVITTAKAADQIISSLPSEWVQQMYRASLQRLYPVD